MGCHKWSFPLPRVLNAHEYCEATIANIDIHVPAEEQIAELEVAVNVVVGVHVVAVTDELDHEEAVLWLGEGVTTAEHVHKGTKGHSSRVM